MGVAVSLKIQVQLSVGVWTDITVDTIAKAGIDVRYGIDGNGPLDRVAGTGLLQFVLNNSVANSGGVQGWYSPAHASKRTGWTFGIPVRLLMTSGAIVDQVRFRGKIRVIAPGPGAYASKRVLVTAYDYMRDLAESDARAVTLQLGKTETALLTALIAVMPADSQPPGTSFDSPVDRYPYAFDDIRGGAKVISVARDVVVSAIGRLFQRGDGTLMYLSRTKLSVATSSYTVTAAEMSGLAVPSSLDKWFNRVGVTTHPKSISPEATEALYALPAGTSIAIEPGTTRVVWTDYTDPLDRSTKVGGTSVETNTTTLKAAGHLYADSVAAGGGSDMSASLTASLTAFASTAKWSLENTHGTATIFVTTLNVIGKAVRDPGKQRYESYVASVNGDRPIEIDLPYQDNATVAQGAADYLRESYSALEQQAEWVEFLANDSAALMAQALTREPGEVISATETVTGLSSTSAVIQSVQFRITEGPILRCRWGLAPAVVGAEVWDLGVSLLGDDTRLGF